MLRRLAVLAVLLGGASSVLIAQAIPTASRRGDAQVGGGFSIARPDYSQSYFTGFGFYGDYDFRAHFGVEAEFHQVNQRDQATHIYERTYEIGGRYVLPYNRFSPYAKAMIGRGVFNFPNNAANLAYNMAAFGGGVDFKYKPRFYIRVDAEYQDWFSFPPTGLTPIVGLVGVAYHWK